MATSIFINLPVRDLQKSMAFFAALGWSHNPQFTDETAASIVVSDTIYLMLLTHDKYRQFTDKPLADPHKTSQVIVAFSADTPEDVNRLADAALKAGGKRAEAAAGSTASCSCVRSKTPTATTGKSSG